MHECELKLLVLPLEGDVQVVEAVARDAYVAVLLEASLLCSPIRELHRAHLGDCPLLVGRFFLGRSFASSSGSHLDLAGYLLRRFDGERTSIVFIYYCAFDIRNYVLVARSSEGEI